MARKPVLEGGKREEIIDAALELFFENGYEATSVRMIMDRVGGEIGMFYHYFKSKDMLFDKAAEKFFRSCREKFEVLLAECDSPESFAESFLPVYALSMEQFGKIKENMHWTIRSAMHSMTLASMIPAVTALIKKWDVKCAVPAGILAGQLMYGISATLHSAEFEEMTAEEQKQCITGFIGKVLER